MERLAEALEAWSRLLGSMHVLTDEMALADAQTTTFFTEQRIPAIIQPGGRVDVQECLRIANTYKIPIYPVSTGKNWGYGSRVPVRDGCVVMELKRLNKILDYDERLAYVTVEPGVTFDQLFEYLRAQKSNLILSLTGSSPESSIIGNTIERGIGQGPYGDKFAHACSFEVVLPTGECIHTGFGRFDNAKAARVARWGIGPFVDGIFTQSNLGVVTNMSVWLTPAPTDPQVCLFTINDPQKLDSVIDALQVLWLQGTVRSVFNIVNDYRLLSSLQQYPWDETRGGVPLPREIVRRSRESWGGGAWRGRIMLHSFSRHQSAAERKLIKQTLCPRVDDLIFVDSTRARIAHLLHRPYRWATGSSLDAIIHFKQSRLFGVPDRDSVRTAYWRKKTAIPTDRNPDRDGCGVIWCSPSVPFRGCDVKQAVNIIEEILMSHQFEPAMSIACVTERLVNIFASIIYDRDVEGEDQRALTCYNQLMKVLAENGYLPYRMSILSMGSLPHVRDDYGTFLYRLKTALDPNDILAPGRYDFRSEWPEGENS